MTGGPDAEPAPPPRRNWLTARIPELGNRAVLVTAVLLPAIAGVVIAAVTAAPGLVAGWLGSDEPTVTGRPAGRRAGAGADHEAAARQLGIDLLSQDTCPWTVWTVFGPPGAVTAPRPVSGSGRGDDDLARLYLPHLARADAAYTRLTLTVQPAGAGTLRVSGVDVVVTRRRPAPGPDEAAVVALAGTDGCGQGPDEVSAHALIGNAGDRVAVTSDRGSNPFPRVVRAGDQLDVHLFVGAVGCDCTWVLEVRWSADNGAERRTPYRHDDREFRTTSTEGLRRFAWRVDFARPVGPGRYGWQATAFDDALLRDARRG